DVAGYAAALERFDAALPRLTGALGPGDILVLSADHGNDPTAPGTDHTRERVPVLVAGAGAGTIGLVNFADVGESIAEHLGLTPGPHGRSFL
ncbi:MAG: phosphopentomutase, partial [Rhodobacteraceae bacterium]|nr:phosphopentomutase [Paracoccaceae bacterium]